MRICLNLSGQIRLRSNEKLQDKINHFKNYLEFDHICMHIWKDDYIKYQSEIEQIQNCTIIIVDSLEDSELSYIYSQIHINPYRYRCFAYLCQFYGLQSVFQRSCALDFDIYIRCRYDAIFYKKLIYPKYIFDYDHPVALVPYGGDWENGLGDVFYILNKKAALSMTNFFYDVIKMCQNFIPLHPESLLRTHFINNNKFIVYRFSFPVSINYGTFFYHIHSPFKNNFLIDNMKFISTYYKQLYRGKYLD